jgi:hypothetical protein
LDPTAIAAAVALPAVCRAREEVVNHVRHSETFAIITGVKPDA